MILNHTIKLIKKNGSVYEDVRGNVQPKMIFIQDISLPIDEGDIFEYITPSQQVWRLIVTNVNLLNFGSSLDHYEIEYVKE